VGGQIQIALETSPKPSILSKTIAIAKKHNITKLQIHAECEYIRNVPVEKRVENFARQAKTQFSTLCIHMPLWPSKNQNFSSPFDLLNPKTSSTSFWMITDCIQEGILIGQRLNLNEVLINIHVLGLIDKAKISLASKFDSLRRQSAVLEALQNLVEACCGVSQFKNDGKPLLKIILENNAPFNIDNSQSLVNLHPEEFAGIGEVKVNFNFVHYREYLNYVRFGHGENPAADVDRLIYKVPSWSLAFERCHNTATGVQLCPLKNAVSDFEPITPNRNEMHMENLIPELCEHLSKNVFGVLKIKNGTSNPQLQIKALNSIKKMLGENSSLFYT